MKRLRCKPSDLAMVIHDVPQCIKNVGRLVRVLPPVELNRYGLRSWLIEPTSPGAWWVDAREGVKAVFTPVKNIEHPDGWLLPLRPDGSVNGVQERAKSRKSRYSANKVALRAERRGLLQKDLTDAELLELVHGE